MVQQKEETKVKRTGLYQSLTCCLCTKLFIDATTIRECLHTFCRTCIENKLIDEDQNHCPKCNVYLGVFPLEKIRRDAQLQDVRDKTFPSEEKKVHPTPLVTKTKKKYQYSSKSKARKVIRASKKVKKNVRKGKQILKKAMQLQKELNITRKEPNIAASELSVVANVKKNENQQSGIELLDEVSTIPSARKAKVAASEKSFGTELVSTSIPDKLIADEKKDGKRPLHETFTETPKIRFKNSSKPESSHKIVIKTASKNNASESRKEKGDKWEPMNCLVENANKTKSLNNSIMQEYGGIPMLVDSSDNDSNVPKVEVKKHFYHQIEPVGDQNESSVPPKSGLKLRIRRMEINQEKIVKFCEDLNLPPKPEIEESKIDFGPIWFSLVASKDQKAGQPLPQISSPYLRVTDGSLPVTYIKKYLVQKLGLANDAEVEILLRGKPVSCSMNVQKLVELWLQTMPNNEKVQTSVGSSAKDFVMVLSYCRKA